MIIFTLPIITENIDGELLQHWILPIFYDTSTPPMPISLGNIIITNPVYNDEEGTVTVQITAPDATMALLHQWILDYPTVSQQRESLGYD